MKYSYSMFLIELKFKVSQKRHNEKVIEMFDCQSSIYKSL